MFVYLLAEHVFDEYLKQIEEEEIDIEHGDNEQSKYAAQRKFLIALHYHTKEYKVKYHLYITNNIY